uniref:Uncharacterized protein n=1 Tax=Arundo donax TaxID=35708 RepID=A0A0A9FSH2_ARUDO
MSNILFKGLIFYITLQLCALFNFAKNKTMRTF